MTDNPEYFKSEAFQEILSKYEKSVKSGHPIYIDADDLADIADYYQYNGFPEKADSAINLALKYNPDAVGPLLYKAREALAVKDYETAEKYAKHIEIADSLEALYLRGEIYINKGDYEAADMIYRQHLNEVMPDELMDFVYDVANIFSEYNIFDKAFEWIARSQGDDSDDFKELMGRTLFGLGKYQDSERIFNELIDHDPYSAHYWNALANAQFMREDYHSAITSSEYAIAIDPNDAESILSKANSLYNLDNFEAALTYFQKYSEKMDADEFGFLHQGACLINLGRTQEAIEILKKAENLSAPDSRYLPEIYQELAFAYNELQQPDTAIHYLDKTNNLDCDHINIAVIKGHVLLSNNQISEAEKIFRYALTSSENSPKIMLRIIISMYDNHYINSTYRLLKSFLKQVDAEWNQGYSYMALCCLEMKKEDEFLYYLKIACEKNPNEAHSVLGNQFPEEMKVEDYYNYMSNLIKQNRK